MIHEIKRGGNFIWVISSFKNCQCTESKALCNSIFMMHLWETPFLLYPLARSWHVRMLNNSSLSLIKAPWFWWIKWGSTDLSLMHKSFATNSYSTLQHEISLKSFACAGSRLSVTESVLSQLGKIALFLFERNVVCNPSPGPLLNARLIWKTHCYSHQG